MSKLSAPITSSALFLLLTTNSWAVAAGSKIIEPIMVSIPGGSFMMGSTSEEDSQPVHKVDIPAFSMGKYEVTVREYRQFVEATGYETPKECYHELDKWFSSGGTEGSWDRNTLNNSDFQPVNCLGWSAANAYVEWLAEVTGKPYRLPSESEWEYAARGGTTTKFYWGDDEDQTLVCDYENTADLAGENILQRETNTSYVNFYNGKSNCVDHSGYASIVGMYKPNPFGLHDMVSNVVEFVADCYQESYQGAPSDGSAWITDECERRSARGGSWHWNTFEVARRGGMSEDFVGGVEGFRVALDDLEHKPSMATKAFASELAILQRNEKQRRDAMPAYPQPVKNLRLAMDNGIVKLSWDKSEEDGVSSYRVYRNSGVGTTFTLLGANIIETSFNDANADNHKYEYNVVAVRKHLQSDYTTSVETESFTTVLPGRLEVETGHTMTGTSVARTSDVDGKFNLTGRGGIGKDALVEYAINVTESGFYQLDYRLTANKNAEGFELLLNDKKITSSKVAETGGYHNWQTLTGERIYLEKGNHKLTMKSLDNNWKLNWIEFKQG